jgi:hypothetical protein
LVIFFSRVLNFGVRSPFVKQFSCHIARTLVSAVKAAFGWTNDFLRIFALDPAPRDCPWLLRQEVLCDAKLSRKSCYCRVCGIASQWQTFLAVEAGASATPYRSIFVAVSINLGRIMEVHGLPGRALS